MCLLLNISIYFYYTNYRFFEPKALPIGVRLVLIPEDCDLCLHRYPFGNFMKGGLAHANHL